MAFKQGLVRQRLVIEWLSDLNILTANQIQLLLFNSNNSNYSKWKTRERLRRWFEAGLVKRGRCNVDNSFVYWLDKKPENMDHAVLVNWVYIYLYRTGNLNEFIREYPCGGCLVSDAYIVYKGKPYFLELQRAANKTPFTSKVKAYNDYAESRVWQTEEWPGRNRFAKVLVVCETGEEKIRKAIEKENRLGLRFTVLTLDELAKNPEVIEEGFTPKEIVNKILKQASK